MTSYSESQVPAARARPTVVTASSGLMVLLSILLLIGDVVGFVAYDDKVKQAAKDAFKDVENGDTALSITEGIQTAVIVLTLLLAVGLILLALSNLRGKNISRILTWVFGGLALLCCGCGIFGVAAGGSFGGDEASREAQEKIADAYPSWYQATSTTLLVLELLVLLTAMILLALPAANEFFRKPTAEWTPPPAAQV